jgi:ribosomal protein L11 methylase PrmA
MSKRLLVALIDGLRRAVAGCRLPVSRSVWGGYYDETNYSPDAMAAKVALVPAFVDLVARPGDVLHDLGANTGRFSQLLARAGRYVVAHDIDEAAVERHYQAGTTAKNESVLPLLLDLASPSPGLGWALDERMSAVERMSGGTVVALALIHHLAISNNVPLDRLAAFLARIAGGLVIEFVPKDDSQVRRLLATREDIFPEYTREGFERAFGAHFETRRVEPVPGTMRTLYAMTRRA